MDIYQFGAQMKSVDNFERKRPFKAITSMSEIKKEKLE